MFSCHDRWNSCYPQDDLKFQPTSWPTYDIMHHISRSQLDMDKALQTAGAWLHMRSVDIISLELFGSSLFSMCQVQWFITWYRHRIIFILISGFTAPSLDPKYSGLSPAWHWSIIFKSAYINICTFVAAMFTYSITSCWSSKTIVSSTTM